MQLYVLIDSSGSMDSIVQEGSQRKKKVDMVKEHIVSYLSSVNISKPCKVNIYSFNTTLKQLAVVDISDAIFQLSNISYNCSGGTKIWDSIHEIIDMEANNASEIVKIICLTDGDDQGSNSSYREVRQAIQANSHIELLIIDIEGKLSKANKEDTIIKTVTRKSGIKDVLSDSAIINGTRYNPKKLDISVPVIPVSHYSKDDINMITNALQEVIPYLEELSGLRYYPVSTYLIDEYTIRENMQIPLDNDDCDEEGKRNLRETLNEFIRFYQPASIGLHVSRNSADGNLRVEDHDAWGRYYKWSEDSKDRVLGECEGTLGITCFESEGWNGYRDNFDLPELKDLENNIDKLEKMMRGLVLYYKELKEIYGNDAKIGEGYFYKHNNIAKKVSPRYFIHDIWQPHFTKRDFAKILKCVHEDGRWKTDLESVSTVYETALPALIKLLKKWVLLNSKWALITRDIRTYGVYLPRNHKNSRQLNKALQKQGYPVSFIQQDSGKVLLCMDRCKKSMEKYKEMATEESNALDFDTLSKGLLKATLIHEHAHAITYEGIGKGDDQYYLPASLKSKKKLSAISETLAEWAELNYFRNDNTKELYEIIHDHASSGVFPQWPYSGALILENSDIKLPRTTRFRSLMQYYRSDAETAYDLLKSW